jgi:aquaporin Z
MSMDTASVQGASITTRERTCLHWPEYAIEAAALGMFMVSAALFATALYHPSSPLAAGISNEWLRRGLMGLAMGSTAVGLIYSPWGQRSGAHMNPSVTLAFFRLGKVPRHDFLGYVLAQFVGGVAGVALIAAALGQLVSHPSIHYVVTTPGPAGEAAAFLAEVAMSFGMMLVVLSMSNRPKLARFTGICAGLLVWAYITVAAPISGMSLNPARTFGSALLAGDFVGLWIYFTAPPLGMLLAAELYTRRIGVVICAKLHHPHGGACVFGCERRMRATALVPSSSPHNVIA